MARMHSPSLAVLCRLVLTGMCFHLQNGSSIHPAELGTSRVTSTPTRTRTSDREVVNFESWRRTKKPPREAGVINCFEPHHGNRTVRLRYLIGQGIKKFRLEKSANQALGTSLLRC